MQLNHFLCLSVYKAVNFDEHRVAACKVILLTDETTEKERKTLDKEIRVHSAMKHPNVLEFFNAAIVENEANVRYVPAIYMLLELASGGDLFDKIGAYFPPFLYGFVLIASLFVLAPEVGLEEEIAQYYFNQLTSGLVRVVAFTRDDQIISPLYRAISMDRAFVIVISSRRTCCWTSPVV